MLEFVGSTRDVADPWYTHDYDTAYRDIQEGLDGFMKFLEERGEI